MKGNNHRGNCHSNDVTTAWRIGRPLPDSVVAIHSRWLAIRRWVPFMGRTFVLNNFTTRITYRIALIVGNNFGKIEWNMCYVFSTYPCYFLLFYLILSFFFFPPFLSTHQNVDTTMMIIVLWTDSRGSWEKWENETRVNRSIEMQTHN